MRGGCFDCTYLNKRVTELEAQLAAANERAARTTDLMVKGEAVRERIMMDAILAGAYGGKKGGE